MVVGAWVPITLYAFVIMVFLGVYTALHLEVSSEQKPFTILAFLTSATLVSDFISRIEITDSFTHVVVVGATYFLFGLLPILGVYWYIFVRSLLSGEERTRAQRLDLVVFSIAAVGLFVLVLNPFFNLVFSYDAAGVYHRGPLFFVPAGMTFLCIIIAEIFISFNVRSLGRNIFISLLLFPIPPAIGSFIGIYSESAPWVPLGISIAIVVLFAILQTTTQNVDFLTGLYTRRRLEELLDERTAWAVRGHKFAAILVDLDDFKEINDKLGHSTGDVALAEAANILKRSVRVADSVSRIGGDEFIILIDNATEEIVETIQKRIESEIEAFNATSQKFQLALSMGSRIYSPTEYASKEDFLMHLDSLMYANKVERKKQKRLQMAV